MTKQTIYFLVDIKKHQLQYTTIKKEADSKKSLPFSIPNWHPPHNSLQPPHKLL